MRTSKLNEISTYVGDRRSDSEAFTDDIEVAEAFDEDQRKQGVVSRDRLLREDQSSKEVSDVGAGDVDVDENEASASGDDTAGGDNTSPGQGMVDENGHAAGIDYDEGEPLHTTIKVELRDQNRWEMNPESAEDYDKESHRHV